MKRYLKNENFWVVAGFALIITIAIIAKINEVPAPTENITERQTEPLDYRIVNEEYLRDIKASLDVILSRNVSRRELKELSNKIYNQLEHNVDRVFITYYRSRLDIDQGAYATAIFDPSLKIKIYD